MKGNFPIGFFIWDTTKKEFFEKIEADVFNSNAVFMGKKTISSYRGMKLMTEWVKEKIPILISEPNRNTAIEKYIGFLAKTNSNDFQNNNIICILNEKRQLPNPRGRWICCENLRICCVYFSVRHCIEATWLNDRDQFLYPNDGWEDDYEFQSDCLVFALFHGQNRISTKYGINHWVPFTEAEVDAKDKFASHFMTDYIAGNARGGATQDDLPFDDFRVTGGALAFSPEASAVFDAGRELWRYYHAQEKINVNASLYDIREYFQGRKENGKMNSSSDDERYMELIGSLRAALKVLAQKIEPRVYEYGFLLK